MKKIILSISLSFLLNEFSLAQITFQRCYGGNGLESAESVQQTNDGGYIIAGRTSSFGAGNTDIYLIKTDAGGDTLWTRTYGSTYSEYAYYVQQTSDSGYIIVGTTEPTSYYSIYLIKTDYNGDTLWTKIHHMPNDTYAFCVQQTSDGGYIVTGGTVNPSLSPYDHVFMLKTNAMGNLVWIKKYFGAFGESCRSVRQTTDGGYILAGGTTSFGIGDADIFLIKTDSIGNIAWSKTFGGSQTDNAYTVQQTTDGGYILGGLITNDITGISNACLIKTNGNGDTLWTKTYENQAALSALQTIDGGYLLFDSNPLLIKTDTIGNILWSKKYNNGYGIVSSVQQTTDGGYILAGGIGFFGAGSIDVYLIKSDSLGSSGCNEIDTTITISSTSIQITNPTPVQSIPPNSTINISTIIGSGGIVTTLCFSTDINETSGGKDEINVFPNPFTDKLSFTSDNDFSQLILYDIFSRKLLQQTFTNTTTLNTSHLAKGIYIYEVRGKNGVVKKGKVVKE
ncbi:MAG: T9SS type A sorting domain-containing protein [Bacteroidia bacterium]